MPVNPVLQVTLPIGIFFSPFRRSAMSLMYTEAPCRREEKSRSKLALYIALFPQLIAGPIVQYKTVEEEIDERHESVSSFRRRGALLFGLGKKMLLANQVGGADRGCGLCRRYALGDAWLSAVAYTFQIYFDFSGYSDMAIGSGAFSASTSWKTSLPYI